MGGGPFGSRTPTSSRSPRSAGPGPCAGSSAFFRPYRVQVAVVLVAILATSLIGLVNPLLLGLLLDNVIIGGEYDKLNLYVGLMIVLPIITGLIGVGQSYLNNVIGQNVMQDLRAALYTHLQSLPLRFFTETRTGEIQSRLANDVGGVQTVVTDTASSITSNLAIAISTIIAMFLLSWQLTHPVARPDAVLPVPDLPGGQGPARGVRRDPEVAGRDDRHHRGDAQRLGHPAVEDVRPAGDRDRQVPGASTATSPPSRSARRWSVAGSS